MKAVLTRTVVPLGLIWIGHGAALQARDSVSSCGPLWMAIDDVSTNHETIKRIGYNTAVDKFCAAAAGQKVDKYLSMATRVWLDYEGDPKTTGINGYVYFEIHNKGNEHTVDGENCKTYLRELTKPDGDCYGDKHHDTKGGTYQYTGNGQSVSYHALGNKIPPSSDFVDKTGTTDSEVKSLDTAGNTLSPFPLDSFDDSTPVACHSHNDYTRDTPLYSALSTGCTSVEADIWVRNGKLVVAHENPNPSGPTIQSLYLDHLKSLIDEHEAVYPTHPGQSLDLLVDFKEDNGDETWDLLVAALEPLRSAGYLSHYDDGAFQQRHITVVASGNAIIDKSSDKPSPIPKALSDSTNPGRAIFVDAVIDRDMGNFDASNAYWASQKYSSSFDVAAQIKAAHEKGFKVRYWDVPGGVDKQGLIDQGLDRLNMDDLQTAAGYDWHL